MRNLLSGILVLLTILSLACGRGHGLAPPSFSMALEPAQVRLLPGLSQTITLNLKPEPGFSGVVELSASGLGPGLDARFTPASLTLESGASAKALLVLTAREDTQPGTRVIAIQAAGSIHVLVADLAVEIPVASFFTVMTYRGVDPGNFAYLAYQDGDGPWTAVPGIDGLYRLPVTNPGGRYGVLMGDSCKGESASSWVTNGFFSSLGEVQTLQAMVFCNPQPGPPPVTFDLSGELAGAAGRSVLISANSGVWSFPAGTRDYAMKLVRGNGDLVAAAYPSTQDYIPSRIIVERGREAQSPSTRDFDFANQGGDPLATVPVQRPVLDPDETFQGTVQYQTSRGQTAILGYGRDLAAYAPFPPAAAQPGDAYVYRFQAAASNHSRVLQASGSQSPGPLAPQFPSNIPPFDLTSSGGTNLRLSLSWSAVTPAPGVHEAVITQQLKGKQAYCYLYFGSSWHRGAGRISWTQPDLSAVPGFDPNFLPQSGAPIQTTIYQSGTQAGAAPSLDLGHPGGLSIPWVAPPGDPSPSAGAPERSVIRMKVQGARAMAAAGIPWNEYWSVSRTQNLAP